MGSDGIWDVFTDEDIYKIDNLIQFHQNMYLFIRCYSNTAKIENFSFCKTTAILFPRTVFLKSSYPSPTLPVFRLPQLLHASTKKSVSVSVSRSTGSGKP